MEHQTNTPLENGPKTLIVIGLMLMVIGFVWLYFKQRGWSFPPKLPLDILVQREGFSFYFPLGWSILLSVLLSGLFYFLRR